MTRRAVAARIGERAAALRLLLLSLLVACLAGPSSLNVAAPPEALHDRSGISLSAGDLALGHAVPFAPVQEAAVSAVERDPDNAVAAETSDNAFDRALAQNASRPAPAGSGRVSTYHGPHGWRGSNDARAPPSHS